MDMIKNNFFIFACWIAAKAIKIRAKQMIKEGVFVNANLQIEEYCSEILDVDFKEVVMEFISE